MAYQERVAQQFQATSELSVPDAIARAKRAIQDLGSVRHYRLVITQEYADGFAVEIRPTILGALQDRTSYLVSAKSDSGRTTINAKIQNFSVYQEKFLFIPVTPKQVPGIVAYERSLDALRAAF